MRAVPIPWLVVSQHVTKFALKSRDGAKEWLKTISFPFI
jgi:hypothetical protein